MKINDSSSLQSNQKKINVSIFLVSFVMLFFELALIRFVSTEARIFAYFTNLILLSCFIGIGFGCYRSNRPINLTVPFFLTTILVVLLYIPLFVEIQGYKFHIFRNLPDFLASWENTVVHSQFRVLHLRWVQALSSLVTLVMFFCILFSMMPLGQLLGYRLNQHRNPIQAYSINVIASLLGVWAFSAMSFIFAPVWMWILISGILLFLLAFLEQPISKKSIIIFLTCSIICAYFLVERSNKEKYGLTLWSPYQKITMRPIEPFLKEEESIDPFKQKNSVGYYLDVNGHNFTNILNLSSDFQRVHKDYFNQNPLYIKQGDDYVNRYNFPYRFKSNAESILILGPGSGNDVASALRYGYKKIDAVEIDPGIVNLVNKYHPENPYKQPRVNLEVNDARSFLKKAVEQGLKYDLIYFAILDAHSQSGTMANMRMDHYVYTQESFQEVKKILKADGVLVVAFWVPRVWIGQRIVALIENSFGWEPFVVKYPENNNGLGPIAIIGGHDQSYVHNLVKNNPPLNNFFLGNFIRYTTKESITTDNWPFFYLQHREIPFMYLLVVGLILVLLVFMRFIFWKKDEKIHWHFFFLGAAFLLLEFQNINKTALLYGSTWIVNAINFSAILVMILLANLFVARWPVRKVYVPYLGLLISLIIIFVTPISFFSSLPFWSKIISSSIFLNLPIFFAGIIFAGSFKVSENKNLAFGSNLLGAVLGGMLENLAFITGIQMLVLLTIVLYFLSFLTIIKK